MLLAALSMLHEWLHLAGDTKRCQLIELAITHFMKRFRPALLDNSQQGPTAAPTDSEQAVSQQQVSNSTCKGSMLILKGKVAFRRGQGIGV